MNDERGALPGYLAAVAGVGPATPGTFAIRSWITDDLIRLFAFAAVAIATASATSARKGAEDALRRSLSHTRRPR